MTRARSVALAMCLAAAASVLLAGPQDPAAGRESYLTWSAKQAENVGRSTYQNGRVGGFWDTRMLKTERSYNYKLAATWLTPDVIQAAARLAQLRGRLSDDDTRALVAEALAAGDTVVMIEIDPREGSGVIPLDWESFLQPAGATDRAVPGAITPALRDVKGLAGVLRRNYDYDRFWVGFPLLDEAGAPLFGDDVSNVELVVRIYDKEGRVSWRVRPSIRARIDELGARRRSEPKAQSPEPKVASLDQPGNLKGSAGWSSNIAVGISSSIRGA